MFKERSHINIILQPIGAVALDDLLWLKEKIPQKLPFNVKVLVNVWKVQPPLSLYDWKRMQYRADNMALWLSRLYSELIRPLQTLVLGIVDSDGFVPDLNFVFGIALPSRSTGLVFLRRLKSKSLEVYKERILKESLHELGHLFGLSHCPNPYCVMSFSNSIEDVDRKRAEFCKQCSEKLKDILSSLL